MLYMILMTVSCSLFGLIVIPAILAVYNLISDFNEKYIDKRMFSIVVLFLSSFGVGMVAMIVKDWQVFLA